MKVQKTLVAILGLQTLLLAGCMSTPTQTEANFGASVRQMIEGQTLNPGTPSNAAITSGDGQRGEKVLETYRTDVSKPEEVKQDVVISVSGSQ